MVSRPAARTPNWIIVTYSWHWAFGALGVAGLAWAVLWMIFGREGTLVQPAHAAGARLTILHLPDVL